MKTDNLMDMTKIRESLELAELQAAAAYAKLGETVELAEKRAVTVKERRISQTRRKISRTGGASGITGEPQLISKGKDGGFIPPKHVLQFVVRMGSFTSAPVKASGDTQDADVKFDSISSLEDLLTKCRHHTVHLPPPLHREYTKYSSFQHTPDNSDSVVDEENKIRLLQWNHLSQTLGTKNDNFVVCPPEALDWTSRRWRLLEEIIRYQPDVMCLQEVDHFDFLSRALKAIGYTGKFIPKPDSPCIYLQGNNGPDGCAIFVKDSKFKIVSESHRILEVWRVQSNQVAVCLELLDLETNKELVVATTHLKARQGALLSTLRNEQGKDLLDWLHTTAKGRPILLSGDFNAPETEPIYDSVCEHDIGLSSTYRFQDMSTEDPYTTWKIRETGEQKYILDYIFHSKGGLKPVGVLEMPKEHQVGVERFPNLAFPSDHLSLVADFHYSK